MHPPKGRQRVPRTVTDLYGRVDLYVDEGAAIASREAKIGHVTTTTPQRAASAPSRAKQLLPIVELAAESGPVLVVHATKRAAERLAEEIATISRGDRSDPLAIVGADRAANGRRPQPGGERFAEVSPTTTRRFPTDVQAEIEDAVRQGAIDISLRHEHSH